ncbi:MAG: hypothetical protein ABJD07_16770 [Gemmatimonadaceae bacterium]
MNMTVIDTESYYHAAYIAAVAIYALYAASLWWRGRSLPRRETGD